MKYLLLLIVLVLIWRFWVKKGSARRQTPPAAGKPAEKMLTCATCRVHLPESEAIIEGDRAFCCEAHRAAAQPKERQS